MDALFGPGIPDVVVLTVEEAGNVLRIGRSLAHQLAARYEATDGMDGLPVIRVAGCLRVPKWALLELATTGRIVRLCDARLHQFASARPEVLVASSTGPAAEEAMATLRSCAIELDMCSHADARSLARSIRYGINALGPRRTTHHLDPPTRPRPTTSAHRPADHAPPTTPRTTRARHRHVALQWSHGAARPLGADHD
jgi:hypothetical protein